MQKWEPSRTWPDTAVEEMSDKPELLQSPGGWGLKAEPHSHSWAGGDNTQGAAAMVLLKLAHDLGPALFAQDPLPIPASAQLSEMTYGLQKIWAYPEWLHPSKH